MKKTIIQYIDVKYNKIFDLMTIESKNLFNSCIFHNKIFTLFKQNIYNDVYILYQNNKYNKDIITSFQDVYHKYYEIFGKYKNIINENNKLIFKHLINDIKQNNIIITTKNYEIYKNKYIKELQNKISIPDKKFQNIFLNDVIINILQSFYKKNFDIIKDNLTNHKEYEILNDNLIEDVRNNRTIITNIDISDLKDKITLLLKNINKNDTKYVMKSQQFIFKKIVYQNKYIKQQMDILPADIILNIIDKYYDCNKGYYALISKGLKANKPKYKQKEDKFNLFYYTSSFKLENNKVRLTIGNYFSNNLNEYIDNVEKYKNKFYYKNNLSKTKKNKDYIKINKNRYYNKNDLIKGNFLYIKLNKNIKNIKYFEIIPHYNNYKLKLVYEKEIDEIKKEIITEKNSVSIDLGMKNLLSIYNPNGEQYIFRSSKLNKICYEFNKKIDKLKSFNSKNNKPQITDKIIKLLDKKNNKIKSFINNLALKIKETYKVKNIILGYNEFWKQNIHLGKKTNKIFCEIPYTKIIKKLENYFNIIKTEESYTSKCDALLLEEIGKKELYSGKRIKRGLFLSGNKKVINADINGAINIMRKKIKLEKINGKKIYNPKILKID